MLKKLASSLQNCNSILMKVQNELNSDEGLSSDYIETLYLSNPLIVTYYTRKFLWGNHNKTHFFVQKVGLSDQRWQNITLNSNKWISNSHRICENWFYI